MQFFLRGKATKWCTNLPQQSKKSAGPQVDGQGSVCPDEPEVTLLLPISCVEERVSVCSLCYPCPFRAHELLNQGSGALLRMPLSSTSVPTWQALLPGHKSVTA